MQDLNADLNADDLNIDWDPDVLDNWDKVLNADLNIDLDADWYLDADV